MKNGIKVLQMYIEHILRKWLTDVTIKILLHLPKGITLSK